MPAQGPQLPPHLRVDDPTILDGHRLWRGVDPLYMLRPWASGVSDGLFRTHELSLIIAEEINGSIDAAKAKYPGGSIVEVTAGFVRQQNLIIARDPDDQTHALVYREDDPGKRIGGGPANQIAKSARFVHIEPEP